MREDAAHDIAEFDSERAETGGKKIFYEII